MPAKDVLRKFLRFLLILIFNLSRECYTFFVLPANNLIRYFEELAEKGWILFDLDPSFLLHLRMCAEQRFVQHQFQEATISHTSDITRAIRSDSTLWLETGTTGISSYETQVLNELQHLRAELRDFFRIGLSEIECHYSVYKPGQFYRKHRDCTATDNRRHFSFVIYLNPEWSDRDGGELVAYRGEEVLFKVSPQIGKMILFRSDLEHEVLPPSRQRFTLTGWMRT